MAIRATRAASGGVTRNTDGIFSPRRRRTSLATFIVLAVAVLSVVFLVTGAESTSVAIVYSFLIALGLAGLALAVSRRVHPLGA